MIQSKDDPRYVIEDYSDLLSVDDEAFRGQVGRLIALLIERKVMTEADLLDITFQYIRWEVKE